MKIRGKAATKASLEVVASNNNIIISRLRIQGDKKVAGKEMVATITKFDNY